MWVVWGVGGCAPTPYVYVLTPTPPTNAPKQNKTNKNKYLRTNTDVDLGKVAQLTPGLAGADLAALVNEAAIRAVRRNSAEVAMFDFDVATKDFYKSRGTDAEKNWKRLTGGIFS